jgi:hypothetical protein
MLQGVSRLGATIVEQLPKALIGLLIPAVQLAWRALQQSRLSQRRARLRKHLADLSTQRDQFKGLSPTPQNELVLSDIERDINETVKELAALTNRPPTPKPVKPKSAIPRALLLYSPSRVGGWILHILFFVSATAWALMAVGFFSTPDDPDILFYPFFLAMAAVPVALLRKLASRYDRRSLSSSSSSSTQKRRGRWVPITLFWISLFIAPLYFVVPFLEEPGGLSAENVGHLWGYSLVFGMYPVLLALASRGWSKSLAVAEAPDLVRLPRWRSAFLLYRPNKPEGWLPLVVFAAGVLYLLMLAAFLVRTWRGQTSDDFIFVPLALAACTLLVYAARRWALMFHPQRLQQVAAKPVEETILVP